MTALRYDWSRVQFLQIGDAQWTASEALGLIHRVEHPACRTCTGCLAGLPDECEQRKVSA